MLNQFRATIMVEGGQSTEGLCLLMRVLLCGRPEHCPGMAVSLLPSRSLRWEVRTGSANHFPAHVMSGPAPSPSSTPLSPLIIHRLFHKVFILLFFLNLCLWNGTGEGMGKAAQWKSFFFGKLPSSPYCSESGHLCYVCNAEENI